jgi:subtilisin family serine protease
LTIPWLAVLLLLAAPGLAGTRDVPPDRQVVITVANPVAPSLGAAGSTWNGWTWSGGYKPSLGASRLAADIGRDYGLVEIDVWPIALLGVYCVVFVVPEDAARAEILRALDRDPRVVLAQPLQTFSTSAEPASTSADPYEPLQYSLAALQIDRSHPWSTGKGVRVAVVDTGAQLDHPDIQRRIRRHRDYAGRVGDLFSDDVHGTAVTGGIAAQAGNHIGIVGVAPDASILLYKACWPDTDEPGIARCNSFTLARALGAASDARADVVNLSLTGPRDPLLEQMVTALIGDGVLVVGADPGVSSGFPASVDGVLSAHDAAQAGVPGAFVAPGVDILTTVPHSGYAYQSGSSLSAANLSGIAALLLEVEADLSPDRIREVLRSAHRGDPGGAGSLSACVALSRLLSDIRCD